MFHNEPECRNTSIGPIAVEENIWSSSSTAISIIFTFPVVKAWRNRPYTMAYLPSCCKPVLIVFSNLQTQPPAPRGLRDTGRKGRVKKLAHERGLTMAVAEKAPRLINGVVV